MNKHEKAGKALISAIEAKLNQLDYNASESFYKAYKEAMEHNEWDAKLVASLNEVAVMLHEETKHLLWGNDSLPVKGPMVDSKWFH